MTDITELALITKIKNQLKNFDTVVLKEGEALALVEALEKAQQRIAEAESFRTAYMEWSDKTDWVNTDRRFGVVKPLGKHRADVLKAYIEHLESRTITVKLPRPGFISVSGERVGVYMKADVDAALAAAGIREAE